MSHTSFDGPACRFRTGKDAARFRIVWRVPARL